MPSDDLTEAALEAEIALMRQALETELIALRNVRQRGRKRASPNYQAAAQTARMAAATTDRLLRTLRTRVLDPVAEE